MFSIDTIESIITKGYAQKQSPRGALKEGVLKFRKIHRKTPVPESLF